MFYARLVAALVIAASLASAAGAERQDSLVYRFPTVVVTANRLPENWFTTALAQSRVAEAELQHGRGLSLADALQDIPGVLTQSRAGNQDIRLTIRGYGARGAGERSNAGTSRGVRVLLDGFPETEPDGRTSFDQIEAGLAQHIDVLRSNSSALWGNASGGVVSVQSRTDFAKPFISNQQTFGDFGFYRSAMSGGSLIDQARLFYSISQSQTAGWRERSAARRWLLNTGVVTPIGAKAELGVFLTAARNIFRIPGPLTRAEFDADPQQGQDDTLNYKPSYAQRDERRFNRTGRLGVRLNAALDSSNAFAAMVYVNPKVLQRSERNTYRDFTRYHFGGSALWRNQARLSDRLESALLAGVDEAYQDGSIQFYNLVNGNRGTTLRTNKGEGANNFGIFAQGELTVDAKTTVTAGARYDNISYFYRDFIAPQLNDKKSFKRISPKAGVSYRFAPSGNLYLSLGGGVEVPAGNETDPPATFGEDTVTAINRLLEPIRSTTAEIGTRYLLQRSGSVVNSISLDAAAYLISVRDDIIPYRGGRFYFTAGKTRRYGFETAIGVATIHGVSLRGTLNLSQNEYRDYVVDSVHYGVPGKTADLAGNEVAGVPSLSYAFAAAYSHPQLKQIRVRFSARGVGAYFVDDYNLLRVDAYTIADLELNLTDQRVLADWLFLSGTATLGNIFDRKHAASAYINPDVNRSGQAIYLEPGLPRNWVASVSLRCDL